METTGTKQICTASKRKSTQSFGSYASLPSTRARNSSLRMSTSCPVESKPCTIMVTAGLSDFIFPTCSVTSRQHEHCNNRSRHNPPLDEHSRSLALDVRHNSLRVRYLDASRIVVLPNKNPRCRRSPGEAVKVCNGGSGAVANRDRPCHALIVTIGGVAGYTGGTGLGIGGV